MECNGDFLKNRIIMEDMQRIDRSEISWEDFKDAGMYVTGASGMIASYFTMFLIYLNEIYDYHIQIYAGIRSGEKARRRFGNYCERNYFHLVQADVNEPVMIDGEINYIVHAASLASPQYYGKMPVETILPNVIGTYELLKYASVHPSIKGFLFLSSGSVYGSVSGADDICENAVGNLDWLAPGNVYGESKRCGEALCTAYFREFRLPIKIARIHHTYGPTMDVKNDKRVFSEFANNILNDHNIVLKSNGKEQRAFCYLSDTISALLKILLKGNAGEYYNVGNSKEYISIASLAEILTGVFPEKKLSVEYQKREDPGYCPSTVTRLIPVNVDKLRALGWEAEITVEEGFLRSMQYLIENYRIR